MPVDFVVVVRKERGTVRSGEDGREYHRANEKKKNMYGIEDKEEGGGVSADFG